MNSAVLAAVLVLAIMLVVVVGVLVVVLLKGKSGASVIQGVPTEVPGNARVETTSSSEQRDLADAIVREAESLREQAAEELSRAQAERREQQQQWESERDSQLARLAADEASQQARYQAELDEAREATKAITRREKRLLEREERLDRRAQDEDARASELAEREQRIAAQLAQVQEFDRRQQAALERISLMTAEEAKGELLSRYEHDAKRQASVLIRDIEAEARRTAETRARELVVSTIQRVASEQTTESVVSMVELPSDDMKGRIIGREGRNIRSFEQITGVNVMIDDTPGSVLLSCFDPVRREAARITLTDLLADGRINPVRIEELHERSQKRVAEVCLRAAEDAVAEVGIQNLHPELMPILGRLKLRTSYGQNVLRHLVECAHLAGVMAAELGLDVEQCKRSAFLHDIGKALTHEMPGTHAIVGADLCRKYGENHDVVHAVEAHHNEVEPKTVEAVLTQACDAISGGRPGARRETLESYVERLNRLEQIAEGHDGVERVFVMQAGREVRVMVRPEDVDDIDAQIIAREIAKQVEEELTFPGQIRVTVVRESRATEVAH